MHGCGKFFAFGKGSFSKLYFLLQEEYLGALSQGMWNRRVEMGGGETVIMHSHSAIVHYLTPKTGTLDLDGSFSHPKSVMRGFAEVDKVESGRFESTSDNVIQYS